MFAAGGSLPGATLEHPHHVVARTERALHAAVDVEQQVGLGDGLDPVRDEDDGLAPGAHAVDGRGEGLVTDPVEVGVGFVEDDHFGITEERAGQCDALALAGGEVGRERADLCFVTLRQGEDQLVRMRLLGGSNDIVVARTFSEPGDVVAHCAGEEFDALRQVADVLAKVFAAPLVEAGAIKADAAGERRPETDEGAGQG